MHSWITNESRTARHRIPMTSWMYCDGRVVKDEVRNTA